VRQETRGEVSVIQQGAGRFVTVACDGEVYHSVADRWPDAVDVAALARYAKIGSVLRSEGHPPWRASCCGLLGHVNDIFVSPRLRLPCGRQTFPNPIR